MTVESDSGITASGAPPSLGEERVLAGDPLSLGDGMWPSGAPLSPVEGAFGFPLASKSTIKKGSPSGSAIFVKERDPSWAFSVRSGWENWGLVSSKDFSSLFLIISSRHFPTQESAGAAFNCSGLPTR